MADRERELNKQKFKQMKISQKIEYIWEYYRWHILGSVIALIITVQLGSIIFGPKPKPYAVDVVVVGAVNYDQDKMQTFNQNLNTVFDANIQVLPASFSNFNELTVAMEQKLMLLIQVKEADLFALSPYKYQSYMQIEGYDLFMELDKIEALKEILENYKDDLLVAKSKATGEEHVFGIKVKNLSKDMGLSLNEDLVISVLAQPKDLNQTIEVLKYLLK